MISRIIDENSIHRLKTYLDDAEKIVVTCHVAPDGDAIGSSLAAMHVFSALGKDVSIVTPDAFLSNLRTLPGAKEIVDGTKYPEFAAQLFAEADLIVCLDFNEPHRAGRLQEILISATAPKVLIDHHLDPSDFADVTISHPDLCSTCFLLFRVLCRLELFNFIDRNAAECLLAGMMTDTGNFSYNASDPEIYIVVAELLKKNADKERLYRDLFSTFSLNCMRLNSYAILKKLEIFREYGAALIVLSRDELNRFHYTKGDTEGLVNRPLSIPGVKFSIFMREETDMVKVSARSVGSFPVNLLCSEYFNGGGHLNAAGGELTCTLEEAADTFRTNLKKIVRKYSQYK